MRVTARTYYQDYAQHVNDLHSKLNRAMEQVGSGRRFEKARRTRLPITPERELKISTMMRRPRNL